MIKIGNILIDPNSVDTILLDYPKFPVRDSDRGKHIIQIIYKSGVVKNIESCQIGMCYNEFIEEFLKTAKKDSDINLIKTVLALKQQLENANTNNT